MPWISVSAAVEHLDNAVTVQHMYRMIGRVPRLGTRLGSKVLVDSDVLDDLIEAGRISVRTDPPGGPERRRKRRS